MKKSLTIVVSATLGLMTGIMFHYVCYRISLPSKPFIYAVF